MWREQFIISKIERVTLVYPHITMGAVMSDIKCDEGQSKPIPGPIIGNIYPYWSKTMKI